MSTVKASAFTCRRVETIARFQFGDGFGQHVESVAKAGMLSVKHSRKTGKLRYVYDGDDLLLVSRPTDGYFSMSLHAARIINEIEIKEGTMVNGVKVLTEVSEFIRKGRNVFAKHVVDPSPQIRPLQEIYVTDEQRTLLAVGKALLSGNDMAWFSSGIAVKVRHGAGGGSEVPPAKER